MTSEYATIMDLEKKGITGKTILLRVDFNSPMEKGVLLDDTRIKYHAETIQYLASKGAKLVVLAHQGRLGSDDFHNLKPHSEALQKYVTVPVKFVPDVVGETAKNEIKKLASNEVLVLDNVRGLEDETKKISPEEHKNSTIVKELTPLADYYVNDAFAAAHRSQASLVGFCYTLPSVAGLVMDREIKGLSKALNPERPAALIIGGTKIDDSIKVAGNFLERDVVDFILSGGLMTTAIVKLQGIEIGENEKVLEKFGVMEHLEKLKGLLDKYSDKWVMPRDVAINLNGERKEVSLERASEGGIADIGEQTIRAFIEKINQAKTIVMNGPMGIYENETFRKGTTEVFQAVANSSAFTIAGGGHTIAALDLLNLSEKISLVSTGGGSMISFLMGKELPVIKALKEGLKP